MFFFSVSSVSPSVRWAELVARRAGVLPLLDELDEVALEVAHRTRGAPCRSSAGRPRGGPDAGFAPTAASLASAASMSSTRSVAYPENRRDLALAAVEHVELRPIGSGRELHELDARAEQRGGRLEQHDAHRAGAAARVELGDWPMILRVFHNHVAERVDPERQRFGDVTYNDVDVEECRHESSA